MEENERKWKKIEENGRKVKKMKEKWKNMYGLIQILKIYSCFLEQLFS